MSMTKRILESGISYTPEERDAQKAERRAAFIKFNEIYEKYLLAFLKIYSEKTKTQIHKSLFQNVEVCVNLRLAPISYSTLVTHIKKSGGINEYLCYFFYGNNKRVLEILDVPPNIIYELSERMESKSIYIMELSEAKEYCPTQEKIDCADDLYIKPRQFKFSGKIQSGFIRTKDIHDFYKNIHNKNKIFYEKNPDKLYCVELFDYDDYLNSPIWFLLREVALFRDGFSCRVCGNKAECVHHIDYDVDTLYGKNMSGLISLCNSCHNKVEFSDSGQKINDIVEKKKHLNEMLSGNISIANVSNLAIK